MPPQIVIVNLSTSFGGPWREDLCAMGFGLTNASSATHAIQCGGRPLRMVVLCSNGSDQNECMDGARCIRQIDSTIPLILLVGEGSEKLAVAALRAGITDYFHMPAESDSFLRCVRRLAGGPTASDEDQQFLGSSPAMQEAKSRLGRIAQGDANVLITGETGTGKELAASVIHRFSSRRDKPFVCVNCAAIPDALVESELFGYERGAFTGAYTKRAGWLDSARDGTLFLDEVGDLSSVAQAKLLRVVENKSFYRLGGNTHVTTNVRFIVNAK